MVPASAWLVLKGNLEPGQTLDCPVSVHLWKDEDRRMIEAGMPFSILLAPTEGGENPLKQIGRGQVVALHDPHGRYFCADAEAMIILHDSTTLLPELNGCPLEWKFARLSKT
jgi:hypothetical protein